MGSDEWLIQRMRKGDERAIEEFVRKYYPMIRTYCGKRLSDTGLAEDLTQETFEHFFRSLPSYRHHGKAANYLYTIAGNLCRDFYKAASAEILVENADVVGSRSLSECRGFCELSYDPMAGIEAQMDVKKALDRIPETYREVLTLHFLDGLGQTEIAIMLQVKLHVVKYRLKKGKKILQELWKEEFL